MKNEQILGEMLSDVFKYTNKQLGIPLNRLCCVMSTVMEEVEQQGKAELVLSEDTLKQYVHSRFSKVCYLDAFSEFVRIFEEAISRISVEYPKAGELWKEHREHILKDFDEIHRLAVEDFLNLKT